MALFGDARREIRFLHPLGKGGFGSVHLADVVSAEGLVQRLAVKILHAERAQVPEIAARARDEARLLSQVNHDNVVKVFGMTEVNGRVAVLMEFVEGVDCAALMFDCRRRVGGGLPPRVAARICECTASALHTAWTGLSPETGSPLHIVHRDIKPTNILLSTRGVVKVMDFGVARGDIDREAQTAAWEFGTRRYMAPERILDGEAGARSDVYSLGATFLELVTGTRFEAPSVRRDEFKKHLAERIEEIRVLEEEWSVSGVSPALGHLLAYGPEDRFSAQEAQRLFASWGDTLPGPEMRHYASEVLPPLIERRLEKLSRDDELAALTGTCMEVGDSHGRGGGRAIRSKARQEETHGWDSSKIQALFILLGVGMVLAALQARNSTFEEQMSTLETPSSEEVPVAEMENESPVVPEAVKSPVAAGKPSVRPANVRVPREGAGENEVHSPLSPVIVPPARVIELVSLKVLADPREGSLRIGDQVVDVGERIEVEVGEHRFEFRADGWDVDCMGLVTTTASRIKFFKDAGLCELR